MRGYTFGVDIGTTSICAVAVDIDSGDVVWSRNRANTSSLPSEHAYERKQNVSVILDTAFSLVDEAEKELGLPMAIGVTGQMHGIVYIDKEGNAVSPLYTWQDARGAQPKENGETYSEHLSKMTGYTVASGYGAVTHFYNAQNGLVPKNAVKLCTVHDFLAMKLAGRNTPLIHSSDAASLGLYDLKNDVFDISQIEKMLGSSDIFPEVTSSTECIGMYKGVVPVAVAIGDNQASFLGSAGECEGTLLVNIGTGSQVSVIGKLGDAQKGIECRPYINGKHLLVGSSLCGGRAYAILEKFFREVANMCGADIKSAYPFMDKWVEEHENKDALCVSTLFDGTRYDPSARGSITGISVDNFEPGAMMYGFMNGIAGELFDLYGRMSDLVCRESITNIIGSGNGLRVNPALCKIISDTFGMPMTLSSVKEEASVGAALFACQLIKID